MLLSSSENAVTCRTQ